MASLPGGPVAGIALSAVVASGLAVLAIGLPLPAALRRAAEAFASPGEFLWWSVFAGAFSGRPTGPTGHVVWVLGSAVFWFVVLAGIAAAIAYARRILRRRRAT